MRPRLGSQNWSMASTRAKGSKDVSLMVWAAASLEIWQKGTWG